MTTELRACVKPLEWREEVSGLWWIADHYRIESCTGGGFSARVTDPQSRAFRTLSFGVPFDAAKAAAQADYEQRILSALVSPSPAEGEAIKEARSRIAEYIAELLNALKPFSDAADQADARNASSEPDGKRVKPWQFVSEPDFAHAFGAYTARLDPDDFDLAFAASPASPPITEQGAWQPIETAPKDGTWFLGWVDRADVEDQYDVWRWDAEIETESGYGFWVNAADSNLDEFPTHWQPLPTPPASVDPSNG